MKYHVKMNSKDFNNIMQPGMCLLSMLQIEEKLLILAVKTKILQLTVTDNCQDKMKEIEKDFKELANLDSYMMFVLAELQEFVDTVSKLYCSNRN